MNVFTQIRILWCLMRPRGLCLVVTLPLLGYGWGHWDRALDGRSLSILPLVLVAWAFFHMGAMWLNAFLDRDEQSVIFGSVVPIPPGLEVLAKAALALGVMFAFWAGLWVGVMGLSVAGLAWAYSTPGIAWKGHPIMGPFVNAVGYAMLSPMAGWWIVGVSPNPRTILTWLLLILCVMVTYYCLQAYQYEEDSSRGYRTFVVTHGPSRTLRLGRCLLLAAFLLCFSLVLMGWYPRIMLIAFPGWVCMDRWLVRWIKSDAPEAFQWPVGFARRGVLLACFLIGLVFVVYVTDSLMGRPVAGLGTASGLPYYGW